jgi:hypothetical protein
MWLISQLNIDLGILKITNGIHLAEAILLGIIIVIQIYQAYRTWQKINILEKAFSKGIRLRHGYIDRKDVKKKVSLLSEIKFGETDDIQGGDQRKITIVEAAGNNEITNKIKDALNHYLIRNYGAVVNFSIIKDIIEREVDNYDEEITQSIPTPLYLGLGATMLGIIFGLLAIPGMHDISGGEDTQAFVRMINPLIDGVKIAMIASMIGLFLTTILSSFKYKDAKLSILNKKNRLLTYLETELLPELYEAEDSGVSGLKSSLDQFSRKATEIVSQVDLALQKSYTSIKIQEDLISRVEQLDITRISRLNIDIFQNLERNMEAFQRFSQYLESMEQIASNLNQFAGRTDNVDRITRQISDTVAESHNLTRFLTSHFEKIEMLSDNAVKAVSATGGITIDAFNLAESHFRQAIENIEREIDNRIQLLNTRVNLEESKLAEKYEQFKEDMHQITSRHLESFRQSYADAVPRFEQLDNLKELLPIKEKIGLSTQTFHEVSLENNNRLSESLNKLNASLEKIIAQNANPDLMHKLSDIEKKLSSNGWKARTNVQRPPSSKRGRYFKIPIPKFLQRVTKTE